MGAKQSTRAPKNKPSSTPPPAPSEEPKNKGGIIRLLELAGEKNLKLQFLTQSMTNISTNKKNVSKITFETDQLNATQVMNSNGNFGIIVWIPPADYERARIGIQQP